MKTTIKVKNLKNKEIIFKKEGKLNTILDMDKNKYTDSTVFMMKIFVDKKLSYFIHSEKISDEKGKTYLITRFCDVTKNRPDGSYKCLNIKGAKLSDNNRKFSFNFDYTDDFEMLESMFDIINSAK